MSKCLRPAKPFLKWVGGKRQLSSALLAALDRLPSWGAYHEPFVGGGALFFALRSAGHARKSYLSDINATLIDTYIALRDNTGAVIDALSKHQDQHCEAYFYELRQVHPETREGRAARLIYLNKTCYNGLYRENSKGVFNTPFGRYKNPRILDTETLRKAANALKGVRIARRPFRTVVRYAKAHDLVYFDPPYIPVSETADFTAYSARGFDMRAQEELAELAGALHARGVYVMASNSMTPATRSLYRDFDVQGVRALRAINSNAKRRGPVAEALITNF
ncbi:MAG: DNA adenine methylase [Pseudomonadota bacterium]